MQHFVTLGGSSRRPARRRAVAVAGAAAILIAGLVAAPAGAARIDASITHDAYLFTTGANALTAGTTDIGLVGDDATKSISLPFAVWFYGASYTTAAVSTNGNIQFVGNQADYPDPGDCLPEDDFAETIFAYFTDLDLTSYGAGAGGVFTGTSGSAPNRKFVVEWRGQQVDSGLNVNFEVVFREGASTFHVNYGANGDSSTDLIVGVQRGVSTASEYLCSSDLTPFPANTDIRVTPSGRQAGACANESNGTADPDVMIGGSFGDKFFGLASNDDLRGFGANDCLYGGSGDDRIIGGTGNDTLKGGDDEDRLFGQEGVDKLYGEGGNDQLVGGDGNDRVDGGDGGDYLVGGDGRDVLIGGAGPDVINARDGKADTITCGDGMDAVRGDTTDIINANAECELVSIEAAP